MTVTITTEASYAALMAQAAAEITHLRATLAERDIEAAFAAGAEAMREAAADAMECSCSRDWNAGQRCTATGYGVLGGLCSRIARDKIRAIPLPTFGTQPA